MKNGDVYHELHRPQFHFTPRKNWTNDPNGLVYYKGEYHLFFQHNPHGLKWGPNTWGHAVSRDLAHWRQIEHAIEPDEMGWIWSGSAVVDWRNTGGFQTGDEHALVAFYTTGDSIVKPEKPCVQSIAYSNDRGRTWTKRQGNPVVRHIRAHNRDPKVVWHEPTEKWVMALYLDENDYVLLGSENMKEWRELSGVAMPGTGECPDFFELPVDGDPANRKWVFWGGAGVYQVGTFDGAIFTPETDSLRAELGANGYAAQTWSDVPEEDGRRIQVSWMAGGKYPRMPFNQQMSFPVELALRVFPEGVRLCRVPVGEIDLLRKRTHEWRNETLEPAQNLIPQTECDLFDIQAEINLGRAEAFGAIIEGIVLEYRGAEGKFTYQGRDVPAAAEKGRLEFRLLVDRTSLELFANGGKNSASFCYLPEACDAPLEFYAVGGAVEIVSLAVRELKSAWE